MRAPFMTFAAAPLMAPIAVAGTVNADARPALKPAIAIGAAALTDGAQLSLYIGYRPAYDAYGRYIGQQPMNVCL